MRILLVASGSGGHIYPALAFCEEAKKHHQIGFLICKNALEEKIVMDTDIEKIFIDIHPQAGYYLKHPRRWLQLTKKMTKLAQKMAHYDAIVAFGGFMSFVAAMSAKLAHKKLYLHEQNAVLGDGNRYALPFARKIVTVYEDLSLPRKYEKKKMCLGNPRSAIALKYKRDYVSDHPFKVLFLAGSLGSETLMEMMRKVTLQLEKEDFLFTIISGQKYYEACLQKKWSHHTRVLAYADDVLPRMAGSNLVIMRAGATSLSEMMTLQIPSIIIPSPYVKHDHQSENAAFLQKRKLALVMKEKEVKEEDLKEAILRLKHDKETLYMLRSNMRSITKLHASKNMLEMIENDG